MGHRVRISLDTNVAFIREDAIDDRPCRDPESWHRTDIDNNEMEYPFSSIRKGEIVRFPFALLEVRLRNSGSRKNEWVEDIIHSHLVKEAPRFSKFVHGVAQLFEDYVNTFPFWLSEMEMDIRKDPQKAYEDEQAKKQKELDDEFAVGSFLKSKTSPNLSRSQHKSQQKGIISPVGSPSVQVGSYMKSANEQRGGKKNDYGTLTSQNAPVDGTVEEPDDDETGEHTHHTERSSTFAGGLKNLFPGFSTSKYATAKRSKQALPRGVSKPEIWIKDQGPVKVEAKVWLANQRTFIKWQHVSIFLASLSLGLFNAAGVHNNVARALSVVYTLFAVFAGVWGWAVYMWRSKLITERSGKDFDNAIGPFVVAIGLACALILNFAFKYKAAVTNQPDMSNGTMLMPMVKQFPVGGVNNGLYVQDL